MNQQNTLLGYILLSSAAALLLLVMAWNGSLQPSQPSLMDKALVSLAFMASCVLGIVLSARPRILRRRSKRASLDQRAIIDRPRYVAHHPNCGSFEDRVFFVKGRKYCSGCLGLMLGSAIALVLAIIYLLAPSLDAKSGLISSLLGIVLVSLCLMEIASKRRANWSHLLANSLLVVGFFMVTVGVFSATGDIAYGLLAVIVCFLWLDTRIQISNWRHSKTCRSCGRNCGFY